LSQLIERIFVKRDQFTHDHPSAALAAGTFSSRGWYRHRSRMAMGWMPRR
jgi:hypothetical protein